MADQRWALLVGARHYRFYNPLKYSASDATKFGESMKAHLGFSDETTILLADDVENAYMPPTRNSVFHALSVLADPNASLSEGGATRAIGEDDVFVFYFSGHGLRSTDGDEFLLLTDSSDRCVADTAVALNDLMKQIGRLPCRHKVLFIDACRAEFDDNAGAKGPGARKGVGELKPEREGIATFYSCDPRDRSYEIDEIEQGVFTHCLIEAVRSPDVVTLREVHAHLQASMPAINDKYKRPVQKPYFVPNPLDMEAVPLFAIELDWVDDLAKRAAQFADARNLGYEWLDKIHRFLADVNAGRATGKDLRKSVLERLLDGSLPLADFDERWKWMEKPTPSVRESKPQLRPGGDTPLESSDE